jgi:thiamine transport system permease protein
LGGITAALVLTLMLGTLGLVLAQSGAANLGSAEWAAIRFTLMQAVLSALISVALAVPLARALARRRFFGRGVLITALGAPFLLPSIVAVLGLLAIFGRNGTLNDGLRSLGLPEISVYGLHGVVLAHVFFNLPLATRMVLQGWQAIPSERLRLAATLGFSPADLARHVERPMLASVLPGAILAVFLICLTSFAVALILGGGPRATTVELAIYQAIRFDFDLPRAALLALVQMALCVAAVILAARFTAPSALGGGLGRSLAILGPRGWRRGADGALIGAAALFLLSPMAAVLLRGAPELTTLPGQVWAAALRSIIVALSAMVLTLGAALALAHLALVQGAVGRMAEGVSMLPLAASGLVLGTGLFLAIFPFASPAAVSLPVLVLVNAALALPFAFRLIVPHLREVMATQGRLAMSLGLTPSQRLRLVTLPRLRRPLGFAAGLAAALSMGDLGAITLFAGPGSETLPLQVWRLMGSYRTAQAEGAALLLVTLSFAVFAIFDVWGRRHADS